MFEANDQLMWPSKTVSSILFLHYRSSVLRAKENLAQKLFVLIRNSLNNRKLKVKIKCNSGNILIAFGTEVGWMSCNEEILGSNPNLVT